MLYIYLLIRYNISMPLIAYTVIRYMRFRFFKGNNEMEDWGFFWNNTPNTNSLESKRRSLASYGIYSMADRRRHDVKVIYL